MSKSIKLIRDSVLPVLRRMPLIGDSFRASSAYYETLAEWIAASGWGSEVQRVHAPFEVRRSKPRLIAPGISADVQDGAPPYESFTERETFIARFDGGYLCTDVCEVMTPDRALIGELLFDEAPIKHKLIKTERLNTRPRTVQKSGRYAAIYSYFSHNYAYWLLDTVARLWILEEGGVTDAQIVVPESLPEYQFRSLELLGYPRERLALFDGGCWQCEHLVVPSFPNLRYWMPNPHAVRWIRERLLSAVGSGNGAGRRLFVNRAPSNNRRLLNRDALMAALIPLSFEEVTPQGMPFDDQIRLFRDAAVIVSPFGAGLANMLFMREGGKVVEMVGSQMRNRHYVNLASALGMQHAYVTSEGLETEHVQDDWNEDYEAPIERVQIALDALGVR